MATVAEIQDRAYTEVTSALKEGDKFVSVLAELANADTITTSELPDIEYLQDAVGGARDVLMGNFLPQRPYDDEISVALPTAPSPTFSDAETVVVPEFTSASPALNLPATPDSTLPSVPTAPTISDPVLPTAPVITLPVAPSFSSVNLPLPPSVDIPSFTAGLPSEDFLTPTNNFTFYEAQYSSTLLDELNSKLLSDLQNGGYGIETADEQALFNRLRDRETELALTQLEEVRRSSAGRGFPLPPGALQIAEQRAMQDLQNKISDVNRDIGVKRADMYVENRRFAIEQAKNVENILIGFHNSVQERALNAARYTLDAAIQIYRAQLDRYNARLDAYRTEAQVFEARIRASLAHVEVYKTQMEGARLEVETQRAQTDLYRAQLAGIEQIVSIYRARMEAAGVQATIERTRLESFRALIDAYQAQVQAKTSQMQMYEAQIKGEMAKVQAYEVEARAYTARVEGLRARADISIANLRQESEQARSQVEVYNGQLRGAELSLRAQVEQLQAKTNIYQADTSAFGTAAQALAEAYRLEQQQSSSNKELILKAAELQIQNVRTELEQLRTLVGTKLDASRIAGQYITALISGHIASINAIATKAE